MFEPTIVAFILSVISLSFSYYQYVKNNLVGDIRHILFELRGLVNWNDRSEEKLFEWMKFHRETELHRCSLIGLTMIIKNLRAYHSRHVDSLVDDL